MPIKPHSPNIYDTSADYRKQRISYGKLYYGDQIWSSINVDFDDNELTEYVSLEEKNLVFCKFLNLGYSSITQLDTKELATLCVLVLKNTGVQVLQAENLVNLIYLDI